MQGGDGGDGGAPQRRVCVRVCVCCMRVVRALVYVCVCVRACVCEREESVCMLCVSGSSIEARDRGSLGDLVDQL